MINVVLKQIKNNNTNSNLPIGLAMSRWSGRPVDLCVSGRRARREQRRRDAQQQVMILQDTDRGDVRGNNNRETGPGGGIYRGTPAEGGDG